MLSPRMLNRALEAIRSHEGLSLEPYLDTTGHWTIGWGHLCVGEVKPEPITHEQADELLKGDFKMAQKRLTSLLPDWINAPESVQVALLDLTFNGGFGLKSFNAKGFDALRTGDWYLASTFYRNSKWARQIKGRMQENCDLLAASGQPPTA
jgi:GH24 family phage-related lysozyme (muramidase)